MGLFRFKHLTLSDQHCAMKIGTDGVLLGAWAPIASAQKVLDIGCGTGLVAHMLAQRSATAQIWGIDCNALAIAEAKHNSGLNGLEQRLFFLHMALQDFRPQQSWDIMVSNPPFFDNGPLPSSKHKQLAKHEQSLNLELLLGFAKKHLSPSGQLVFIYPANREMDVRKWASNLGFGVKQWLEVFPTPSKSAVRHIWCLSQKATRPMAKERMVMRDENGDWSANYKALSKDFYLHF